MKDLRPWTYAALYGALWGALETTAGTALHLGRVPFRGEIMGILGLVCLVCLRRLQPRVGVVLVAGVTAIFLKIFTCKLSSTLTASLSPFFAFHDSFSLFLEFSSISRSTTFSHAA